MTFQQQQQYGLPTRLEFVVNLELSEWLMITGKGRQNNLPLVIPAGQTIIGQLVADNQLPYVMVDAIQFDGVLSGQLAFELQAGIQRVAGWAVPQFIQTELLLSEKGRPIRYQFNSSQTSDAVVNIDYISMDSDIVDNEIMPAMWRIALGAR
jgi:hypothetical protein